MIDKTIPVVDIDQAFPTLPDRGPSQTAASAADNVGPQVNAAIREVLGWRPRVEDPKAFVDALSASFRLANVQGHTEATFVPRGYAVQADLGAVTGGQASLYRRATIARTEMIRIIDGQTSLRVDADPQDIDAYRNLVRAAVERLVDELGAAGGPRVEMVDTYFRTLTGQVKPKDGVNADNVAGQLGLFRDEFGLIDENVNTVEEEGVRTAFWTLVDLVVDLQTSWHAQRKHFSGNAGQGFLGTELIVLSRLMEASADQVDELEAVFDSVLVSQPVRRTVVLNPKTSSLTLDGLLLWLRSFLSDEGRRIIQDAGRDGIVSALVPTLNDLFKTFRTLLADRVSDDDQQVEGHQEVRRLPASCCSPLPTGMYAARSRIAIANTCRLLKELTTTAQRVGRYSAPLLIDVMFDVLDQPADVKDDHVVRMELRGLNFRPSQIALVVPSPKAADVFENGSRAAQPVRPLADSFTADEDSLVALYRLGTLVPALPRDIGVILTGEFGRVIVPAQEIGIMVVDRQLGTVVHAPEPLSWQEYREADIPTGEPTDSANLDGDETSNSVPGEAAADAAAAGDSSGRRASGSQRSKTTSRGGNQRRPQTK